MKFKHTFYYTKEIVKRSKMYGCQDVECRVYQLDEQDGHPKFKGTVTYNTASTPGAENEVFMFLRNQGLIKCKYQGYYFFDSGVYDKYKIYYVGN